MPQQVILNLDQMDDPVLGDGTLSFAGGMVSNEQANLLGENQSSLLLNCDRTRLGRIVTRKGSVMLGTAVPGIGPIIQGMAYFWVGDDSYLVAASGGKIYALIGGVWAQIATGGVKDNDVVDVVKTGAINKTGGYNVGETTLLVDGFVGPVNNGDQLALWQRDKGLLYTITGHTETGGNTTQIVIADPGTAVRVYDNDEIKVKRLGGRVNNPGGYPGGATTIAIDGIPGILANGDRFAVRGEEIIHTITAHSETGGNTTSVTFTPALQGQYVSADPAAPIIFALGGNKLYWTDGAGDIYSWDGRHTGNLGNGNLYDEGVDPAPAKVAWVTWFQNRLIAAGPLTEPDAIYFSDFLDATSWDANFQQIRVGGGESDPIVAVLPWVDMNLAVFKEHSIYAVNMNPAQNPIPEDPTLLVASYGIKLVTHYVGCAAPRAVAQVGGPGGDIFFLGSDRQVRSLRRTVAAENQQEMGESVSLPVQDVLDRITPDFIGNSVAYYWNNRYMLAIPVDGAQFPNMVLVYDTALASWSGTWEGWQPTAFATMLMGQGKQALAIGQANNFVIQWLEDTGADEQAVATYQDLGVNYPTAVLTRAYSFGDLFVWKTGLNCEFEFTDSLATVNISARVDLRTISGAVAHFNTSTFAPLRLPFRLPAVLPISSFKRFEKDLQRFGQWRELQLYFYAASGKFACRSVKLTGFMDSLQLQTLGDTPLYRDD